MLHIVCDKLKKVKRQKHIMQFTGIGKNLYFYKCDALMESLAN